ncbi:MAG: SAM-dependent methyltransferase, partial [Betaproteobacteria bacterium]|nr:SAM-dependent methyltransferase [Betaproteobacteria bacterium]
KNELILARCTGQTKRASARRLRAILEEFGLQELAAVRYPLLDAAPNT